MNCSTFKQMLIFAAFPFHLLGRNICFNFLRGIMKNKTLASIALALISTATLAAKPPVVGDLFNVIPDPQSAAPYTLQGMDSGATGKAEVDLNCTGTTTCTVSVDSRGPGSAYVVIGADYLHYCKLNWVATSNKITFEKVLTQCGGGWSVKQYVPITKAIVLEETTFSKK